jgi:DNA adenine methylase
MRRASSKVIDQIRTVAAFGPRVQVHFGDAIRFLQANAEQLATGFSFVYVDPPYYAQGKNLYRHSYTDADHVALAAFLRGQGYPWLLSYDNHPRIRELYAFNQLQLQPIYLDYKVKPNRRAQELVISNLVIPPCTKGLPCNRPLPLRWHGKTCVTRAARRDHSRAGLHIALTLSDQCDP